MLEDGPSIEWEMTAVPLIDSIVGRGRCVVVFFSSRRRHTRWTGDWSSDVCSSDLEGRQLVLQTAPFFPRYGLGAALFVGAGAQGNPGAQLHLAPAYGGSGKPPQSRIAPPRAGEDRKSVVKGKRGEFGGGRVIKKKK